VYSIQRCVIKLVSELLKVGGFLCELWSLQHHDITEILLQVVIKIYNSNHPTPCINWPELISTTYMSILIQLRFIPEHTASAPLHIRAYTFSSLHVRAYCFSSTTCQSILLQFHYMSEHTASVPLHVIRAYCFSSTTCQSILLQFHYMSEHTASVTLHIWAYCFSSNT
jgi:hypothetical protein